MSLREAKRRSNPPNSFWGSPRRWRSFCATAMTLLAMTPLNAADVYLGLQAYGSGGKALGVGLTEFAAASSSPETATVAQKLRSILREDLLFARYFNIVEGGPRLAGDKIDSVAWGTLGAQV